MGNTGEQLPDPAALLRRLPDAVAELGGFEHHYLVQAVDGHQVVPLRVFQQVNQLPHLGGLGLLQRQHGHHPGLGEIQLEEAGHLLQLIGPPFAANELQHQLLLVALVPLQLLGERSRYNGIVNIAVQNKQGVAQAVGISGEARNLTGTLRPLNFQEVKEGNAIYYLAVLPYRNEDTYQFTLKIMGEGLQQTLTFQQTFYVD